MAIGPTPDRLKPAPGTAADWLAFPALMTIRHAGGAVAFELCLASLLLTLLALASPIVLLQTYDRIIPNAALGTLGWLVLGALAALMLESALRVTRAAALARLAARAEADTHAKAMERLLRAPQDAFDRHGNGYYTERLAAIGTLREAWSGAALQTMLDPPFALIYLLAIWFLAGSLVLAPLGLIVIVTLVGWRAGARVRSEAGVLARAEERRFNFLVDTLRGFATLKLLGAERLFERRYERLQARTAFLRRRLTIATAATLEQGAFIAQIGTIVVTAWGCLLTLQGELTVGALGACAMLTTRGLQPLLNGINIHARHQALADASARLAELAALPDRARPDLPDLVVGDGAISLEEIRFGSMVNGEWLFDNLNLRVQPTEFVAFNSPNGSGRSSLLQLMSGQARPNRGRVMIDGQDLARHNLAAARQAVALVPTDPPLIRASLLRNLTLDQPDSEEQALELAAALGLEAVAGQLAEGWHTEIGPGATPLAHGIAQRIGIVRALIHNPRILLLDDVTARLDHAGDQALTRLLVRLKGGRTIILISHRPSVLAVADRVLTIADGGLADMPGALPPEPAR
jgi:ATP-binding cassette subfamily C protein LapB